MKTIDVAISFRLQQPNGASVARLTASLSSALAHAGLNPESIEVRLYDDNVTETVVDSVVVER